MRGRPHRRRGERGRTGSWTPTSTPGRRGAPCPATAMCAVPAAAGVTSRRSRRATSRPGTPPRLANADLPGVFERYFVDEKVRMIVDPLRFDFDHEPATFARSRRIYDALSVDLRALKNRGSKILLWHGWADGAIMATSSIGYYEGVMRFMGGRKATENFFRLFLIPGVHHGGGGPGFTEFDSFTALENWVERGIAPDKLIASRMSAGAVERSRPVYPYPVQARYLGTGDPRRSESFEAFESAAR